MHTCFGLCFQANVFENLSCFYACFETSSEKVFVFSKCILKYLCITYVSNQVFEVCFETFILCFEISFPNSFTSKHIGICFETSLRFMKYVSKPLILLVDHFKTEMSFTLHFCFYLKVSQSFY